MSPATSEMNLFGFNSRSTSPVGMSTPTLNSPRTRISAYDTLLKRRAEVNNTVRLLFTHTGNTHSVITSTLYNVFFFFMFLLIQVVPTHYSMRSATLGAPNKKDYIEELTKQLDICQKVDFIT